VALGERGIGRSRVGRVLLTRTSHIKVPFDPKVLSHSMTYHIPPSAPKLVARPPRKEGRNDTSWNGSKVVAIYNIRMDISALTILLPPNSDSTFRWSHFVSDLPAEFHELQGWSSPRRTACRQVKRQFPRRPPMAPPGLLTSLVKHLFSALPFLRSPVQSGEATGRGTAKANGSPFYAPPQALHFYTDKGRSLT
jgi:hypothetical protein